MLSLQEARDTVDLALNRTVEGLFASHQHTNRTPAQLLRIFRYPSGSRRELARAGEIYQRTLELVEAKVREGGQYNLTAFTVGRLISPANLELIGNLSGCEALRREADCQDVCFHSRFRSIDGSCNNHQHPLWGASLSPLRRLLPPQYENGFNSPIGSDPSRLYGGYAKPNPRLVSTKLISSSAVEPDPKLSNMVMQWGQWLDHDISHSMEAVSRETFRSGQTCGSSCSSDPPCFPIPVPTSGDSRLGRGQCIEFTRSAASCGSGTTSVFFQRLQHRYRQTCSTGPPACLLQGAGQPADGLHRRQPGLRQRSRPRRQPQEPDQRLGSPQGRLSPLVPRSIPSPSGKASPTTTASRSSPPTPATR